MHFRLPLCLLTLTFAVVATSCGGKEEPAPPPQPTPAPVAKPAPEPEQPAEVAKVEPTGPFGTISGTVTGPAQTVGIQDLAINMKDDPKCAGAHDGPVIPSSEEVGPNGEVPWTFVYVQSGLEKYAYPTPEEPATLNQVGCMFDPHVIGLMVDQKLEIHNSDETLHNVHALPNLNKQFNIGHPPVPGLIHKKSFKKPEMFVKFKCDVHPWMAAYVSVMEHPIYAVSAKDGSFALPPLPAGDYTLSAWHEKFGEESQEISVPADGEVTVAFVFE